MIVMGLGLTNVINQGLDSDPRKFPDNDCFDTENPFAENTGFSIRTEFPSECTVGQFCFAIEQFDQLKHGNKAMKNFAHLVQKREPFLHFHYSMLYCTVIC